MTRDEDVQYAVAIAALPRMTPQRLRRVLGGRAAEAVFEDIRSGSAAVTDVLASMPSFAFSRRAGKLPVADAAGGPSAGSSGLDDAAPLTPQQIVSEWKARARVIDVRRMWQSLEVAGISAVRRGSALYPVRLGAKGESEAPEVLFVRGDITVVNGPAVSIVGTRKATHYGQEIAAELGAALTRAGVCVISGLALGIDAAAHEGALAGIVAEGPGPLGVLGGGVDVYYPSKNRRLIDRVREAGCVISEAPPGVRPDPWRFPLRNRIIAGLCQVLVIVESPRHGGAMHTVEAAQARDREIFAVPGSIRSLASEGTNELIVSGAFIARGVDDVLMGVERQCVAEGIALPAAGSRAGSPGAAGAMGGRGVARLDRRVISERLGRCTREERSVYEALDEHPVGIDVVCERSGAGLGAAALALDRLLEMALVEQTSTGWLRL